MKTIGLGPWLGINNRLPDFSLHVVDKGDFLRSADNLVVDNDGSLRLRPADVRLQAMTAPHSWFAVDDTTGYLVRSGVMYAVDLSVGYAEALFKVLSNDSAVSWLAIGESLYWSNGTDSGRITASTNAPWGLPTPAAPAPTNAAGTLWPGTYRVALSYSNATTGEEGGIGAAGAIVLPSPWGISVPLPTAAVVGATHLNVYVSTVNGSVLFLQESVAIGTSAISITSVVGNHREAPLRYEEPLPAGVGLFESNGRLCSVVGTRVYYGLPWRHGYYDPVDGYLDFPAPVSLGICNQTGTFICADKTRWFPGDLATPLEAIRDVLPYGAVPGTAFFSPDQSIVGWFGEQGLVLASPDGEVRAVMSDHVALTPPETGYAVVLDADELTKVVSCGWCLNLDTLAVTTYRDFDYTSTSGGYGTKPDGLYRLEDAGVVSWSFGVGKINFGVDNEKYLPAAYAGCSSDEPIVLTVSLPDGKSYDYAARSCSDEIDIHRFDPGRGLRANWFDLTFSGTNAAFVQSSVSFVVRPSQRRV